MQMDKDNIITFGENIFRMPHITAIQTPTYSLIHNEIPNNLPPEIFKMLAPASQQNYIEGKKQIEINIHNGMENQLGVVHYFFSIPEREIKFSLFEWLRWCLKLNMPRDYNTWVPDKDAVFHLENVDDKVDFNMKSYNAEGMPVLLYPQLCKGCKSTEIYCKKHHISLFKHGRNNLFFNFCRKLCHTFNPLRHSDTVFVSLEQILVLKAIVECFIIMYQPFFHTLKSVLRGDYGENIGTPPYLSVPNLNLRYLTGPNPEKTLENYSDIAD
jgi:hypothetical protein